MRHRVCLYEDNSVNLFSDSTRFDSR